MKSSKWPDFFIVGAPRSGSSSLYIYLRQVPGIFMPENKEPNYFSVSTNKKFFFQAIRDEKKYLKLFKDAQNEIVGESSPSYLRDPKAPKLIHEVVPSARIIISLRDPVERAFSHYLFSKSMGLVTKSFSKIIKNGLSSKNEYKRRIIEAGLYSNQVKRYLDTFGSKQVKILIFEELIKNTKPILKDLLEFLGSDATPPNSIKNPYGSLVNFRFSFLTTILRNEKTRNFLKTLFGRWVIPLYEFTKDPNAKKPTMNKEDRKLLEEVYHLDILELEKLLNRTVPWFNSKDKPDNN